MVLLGAVGVSPVHDIAWGGAGETMRAVPAEGKRDNEVGDEKVQSCVLLVS